MFDISFLRSHHIFYISTLAEISNRIGIKKLPASIEMFYSDSDLYDLRFSSREKKTGNIDIQLTFKGHTFSDLWLLIQYLKQKLMTSILFRYHILRDLITLIG